MDNDDDDGVIISVLMDANGMMAKRRRVGVLKPCEPSLCIVNCEFGIV
jgi:hypothetical protein